MPSQGIRHADVAGRAGTDVVEDIDVVVVILIDGVVRRGDVIEVVAVYGCVGVGIVVRRRVGERGEASPRFSGALGDGFAGFADRFHWSLPRAAPAARPRR
jgi:hypothetical protein